MAFSNCSRATLIERRSQSSLPNWERNGSFTLFRNQERRGSDTQFFRERSNERHSLDSKHHFNTLESIGNIKSTIFLPKSFWIRFSKVKFDWNESKKSLWYSIWLQKQDLRFLRFLETIWWNIFGSEEWECTPREIGSENGSELFLLPKSESGAKL